MAQQINDKSLARPCVLVVEDDNSVRRSLQLLLRSRGLDVRAYASPKQVLADPQARSAECLVADLVMPEVDGMELLSGLRAGGWNGPAILISGFLTDDLEEKARQAGFGAVLRKPFADARLIESVTGLIAGSNGGPPVHTPS